MALGKVAAVWGTVAVMATMSAAVGFGCANKGQVGDAKTAASRRDTTIVHESCSGADRTEDINNDGKPDVHHFMKGSVEVCRTSDLDFDGKPEIYTYYDGGGVVRRREFDFDGRGRVTTIETYKDGKLAYREIDTANIGRLDTWDFFDPATGRRTRRERDINGDGVIDQWWNWESETRIVLMVDRNNDGQPDADSAVVWDANGIGGGKGGAGGQDGGVGDASAAAVATAPQIPTAAPTASAPSTASDAGAPADGGEAKPVKRRR
ncbi:MAG: hypothetical protein U0174_20160 [Polyangiaceae bacterium]